VSLFITLDRSSVFPDQWIYFPQRTYPFGRITEPRNFSAALAPSGKTSLLIEFFCWEHEPAWTASPDSLAAMALPLLEKSGFIKAHEVLNVHVHREKYAYPLYDLNYAVHRKTVMEYLSGFENLTSVGRLGLFKYNNLDHAIEMGLLAARSLMEGRRYAIDSVGTQQHYLEDGESQSSAS
jgi:protoporphyrinogen oxidase